MAKSARIKMNNAGVRKLLKSADVQADLKARIEKVAQAAAASSGEEVETRVYVGNDRARASARINTRNGGQLEAEHGYLQRALPRAGD